MKIAVFHENRDFGATGAARPEHCIAPDATAAGADQATAAAKFETPAPRTVLEIRPEHDPNKGAHRPRGMRPTNIVRGVGGPLSGSSVVQIRSRRLILNACAAQQAEFRGEFPDYMREAFWTRKASRM
jgi:hypothetical protein